MGFWIAAAVLLSIAFATLSFAWARSSTGGHGMSLAAGVAWIVAALSWFAAFSTDYQRIGAVIGAGASVLGLALTVLAAQQRREAAASLRAFVILLCLGVAACVVLMIQFLEFVFKGTY